MAPGVGRAYDGRAKTLPSLSQCRTVALIGSRPWVGRYGRFQVCGSASRHAVIRKLVCPLVLQPVTLPAAFGSTSITRTGVLLTAYRNGKAGGNHRPSQPGWWPRTTDHLRECFATPAELAGYCPLADYGAPRLNRRRWRRGRDSNPRGLRPGVFKTPTLNRSDTPPGEPPRILPSARGQGQRVERPATTAPSRAGTGSCVDGR